MTAPWHTAWTARSLWPPSGLPNPGFAARLHAQPKRLLLQQTMDIPSQCETGGVRSEALCSERPIVETCSQHLLNRVPRAHRTQDNRMSVAVLSKATMGEHWRRLFRGDPDGARCLLPPYRLAGHLGCLSFTPQTMAVARCILPCLAAMLTGKGRAYRRVATCSPGRT